jgi:hypothetical protein
MQPLPTAFTYHGFRFRQLAREGDVALFEKRKPAHSRPGYEVVIVKLHPAQTIHGRAYVERESMPRSESWGTLGWSFTDLESAQTKFRLLVNSVRNADSAPTPFPAGTSGETPRLSTAETPSVRPAEMAQPSLLLAPA